MAFKTLEELFAEAERTKAGDIKYPLDCGCKGPHEPQMCAAHQLERFEDRRRLMGVPDLRFSHRDFLDLPNLVNTLQAIKLQLISNPTKSCIIKVIPGGQPNEAHASSRD